MINRFEKYIGQNNLIKPGDRVLLAVSGGVDSVVMLNLFHKTGIKYAIAHCNFKLRGAESDVDEKFVRLLAHNYNVEVFSGLCNATDYSKKKNLSMQEAARELRYAWFNKVCLHNNYSLVAVAHNHDDTIETFFINLFRGAGLKGLKSIPAKRQNIIRPLMFATRNQIEEYANKHNLEFREDSSNKSDYYLRNKIRHHLIPKIEEISPGFSSAIEKSIDNLKDSDLILQSAINEKIKHLFIANSTGTINVSIPELLKLSPFEVWMYYLLNKFGFNRQITDSICVSLLEENRTGLKFSSPDYELLIDRNYLLIRKHRKKSSSNKYKITKEQNEIAAPVNIIFENHKNAPEFIFSKNNNIAYFDFAKLIFPLTIRHWEVGDRIIPFGMTGSKLISDILIDSKVDLFEKENTYVVLSGEKVIWLVGHRSSNEFKVTKSTKHIFMMELRLLFSPG
ncbi:MAG: tRNA lysidine(34) synthetase TilS [Bacteroidetes bacterium]|nr:tRNA lysidine(34) synthetase TilS [Bacteroidota bacterium]MBL6943560.1 tRNA lysidine(34) synthetase TilS [Bacteroidales bacterium]